MPHFGAIVVSGALSYICPQLFLKGTMPFAAVCFTLKLQLYFLHVWKSLSDPEPQHLRSYDRVCSIACVRPVWLWVMAHMHMYCVVARPPNSLFQLWFCTFLRPYCPRPEREESTTSAYLVGLRDRLWRWQEKSNVKSTAPVCGNNHWIITPQSDYCHTSP